VYYLSTVLILAAIIPSMMRVKANNYPRPRDALGGVDGERPG
jgi:hypothetical protein